jgi:hypothetical protein
VIPTEQEAGWVSELVWMQRLDEKSFVSVGDQTPVQSVVKYYIILQTKGLSTMSHVMLFISTAQFIRLHMVSMMVSQFTFIVSRDCVKHAAAAEAAPPIHHLGTRVSTIFPL